MSTIRVVFLGLLFLLPAISLAVPASADTTTLVTIKNGASANRTDPGYSPATITVVVGVNATVVWLNNDAALHTVTGVNNGTLNSGNLSPNQSYTFTFTSAGSYPYYCIFHGWMHGTVIVKSGSVVPEFPVSSLALILFGVVAVAAVVVGRFKPKAGTTYQEER